MKYHLSFLFTFAILFTACSKKDISPLPTTGDSFTDSIFGYLNTHLPVEDLRHLNGHNYVLLPYQQQNRFLLLHYNNSDRMLLIQKTPEGFTGHHIQFNFTDSDQKNGSLLTENMLTKNGHRILFENGAVTKIDPTTEGQINSFAVNQSIIDASSAILPAKSMDVDVYIYVGGGGAHGVSFSSMYYMTDFDSQFYYSYVSTPVFQPVNFNNNAGDYSTTGYTNAPVVDLLMVTPASKPIDIRKELECFSIVKDATYSLRINVNQPRPTTRDIINVGANKPVGHTYITLEQKNPDGKVYTRNVGWYPKDFVKPNDGTKAGAYQDDTETPFTVAMTVSVSPAEFMNAKNYLLGVTQYHLQKENCTTIAINAFAQAGVNLPRTIGTIDAPRPDISGLPYGRLPIFKGVNPGDLGEDIRETNVNTFSQKNGNKKITIERSNSNNKTRTRQG